MPADQWIRLESTANMGKIGGSGSKDDLVKNGKELPCLPGSSI